MFFYLIWPLGGWGASMFDSLGDRTAVSCCLWRRGSVQSNSLGRILHHIYHGEFLEHFASCAKRTKKYLRITLYLGFLSLGMGALHAQ